MSLMRSDSCFGSDASPMGTLEQPKKFRNQDFEKLRDWHLEKGTRFTDESFPANMNSIGLQLEEEFATKNIVWKRPLEICGNPQFTVDGISLFDILQSKLGNCWVLSAIGSVTLKPRLLENIMPPNQEFSKSYAGIFHFRLWHLGEWVDVVIDDRLPFLDGKYLSVQPSCQNEFWPCLLEKAYAKFLGSYQNLHWGHPAEAFGNLTGGLTMTFDLNIPDAHTYWNMISLASRDTIMACISDNQDPSSRNQNTRMLSCVGNLMTSDARNTMCRDRAMRSAMRDRTRRDGRRICPIPADVLPRQQLHMEHIPEDFHTERGQRRCRLSKSPVGYTHPQQVHMENNPDDFRNRNVAENRQYPYQNQLYMDNPSEDLDTRNVLYNGPSVHSDEQMENMLSEKLTENVRLGNGLVERHAYSITSFAEVPFRDRVVRLIRIWNPWGYEEWNGNWSDSCPLWKELREEDRLRLQSIDENGEFWMSWEDFINEFSSLIICNQVPDFYDWGDKNKKWYINMVRDRWTKKNFSWNQIDIDFFNMNPLYSITVTESDGVKSGEKNVVVSLMQASRNRYKYDDWLPIGFQIFKLHDSLDKLPSSFLTPEKISSIKASKKCKIIEPYNLSPGRYGIIPYTTQKQQESPFLLQVFLKSEHCTEKFLKILR